MLRNFFLSVSLLVGLISCSVSSPANTVKVNPERTIKILGVVSGSIVKDAQALDEMSAKSSKPVYLIINSPGGSVAPGMQFINSMLLAKARGVNIVCVVPNMAASMAFQILAECNERYAFKYSLLLFHPMRIGGSSAFTADEMDYLSKMMKAWEGPMNARLLEELQIPQEMFDYHHAHETLWTTVQLREVSPNFIKIIDRVDGTTNVFQLDRSYNSESIDKNKKGSNPVDPLTVSPIIYIKQ